jgi:hypothetical protein
MSPSLNDESFSSILLIAAAIRTGKKPCFAISPGTDPIIAQLLYGFICIFYHKKESSWFIARNYKVKK